MEELNLKAVVLLAGSVRPSPLRRAISQGFLSLPIDGDCTILDAWQRQLNDLATSLSEAKLHVRIMQDRSSVLYDLSHQASSRIKMTFEQDPFAFRGTGGLLRDLAEEYDDDEFLFVANAAQVVLGSVKDMVRELATVKADIAIAAEQDGTPSDIMLIRSGILKTIGKVGYVDIKEQALPQISKKHDVRVHRSNTVQTFQVRTLDSYLNAIKEFHVFNHLVDHREQTLEDWQATFSIVDTKAKMHPTAIVHDSVVLEGSVIEENAVIVRSVIAPNGYVASNQSIVDTVISSNIE
ncbi:hypothetical protein JD969_03395 [Planctomycetota bacterium]|nr:hypothetical protein JD969_03395 [Planctomycetota bacterium]